MFHLRVSPFHCGYEVICIAKTLFARQTACNKQERENSPMIGTDFWTLRNAWLLARPEAIFEIRISVRPGIPLKRLCPWDAKYRAARKKWEWSTLSLVLSPYFLIAPESRAVLVMCSQGGLPLECWVRSLR